MLIFAHTSKGVPTLKASAFRKTELTQSHVPAVSPPGIKEPVLQDVQPLQGHPKCPCRRVLLHPLPLAVGLRLHFFCCPECDSRTTDGGLTSQSKEWVH